MKITAEPRSDQLNADDFLGSSGTFTIAKVVPGKAEQKYDIELVESPGRVWRPPLTVLRVLMAAWGDDASVWEGRRATLFCDPSVRFGNSAVGGIRVSHLSDLPDGKPLSVNVTEKRGKRSVIKVDPLPDAPAPATKTPEPIEVRIPKAVAWFAGKGVPTSALEAHVNSSMDEWSADDLDTLMAARDELVELNATAGDQGEATK